MRSDRNTSWIKAPESTIYCLFFAGLSLLVLLECVSGPKQNIQVWDVLCSFVKWIAEETACSFGFHLPQYFRWPFSLEPTQVPLSPINIIRDVCGRLPTQKDLSLEAAPERNLLSLHSVLLVKLTIFFEW